MTRARNTRTGAIESGLSLKKYSCIDEVPKGIHECPNQRCRYPAFPWAIGSETRDPFFSYRKHHIEGCHFEGMVEQESNQPGEEGGTGTYKLPHINEFKMPPKPKKPVFGDGDGNVTSNKKSSKGGKGGKRNARQHQTSYMVGALVDFYLEDIEHHSVLPLQLLTKPLTYTSAFQEITSKPGIGYNTNYIFYCEIKNSVDLAIESDSITVELMSKNHNGKNYKVVFDCSDWTEHQKSSLIDMFEYSKDLATKAFFDQRADKAFVFFIGRQDNVKTNLFHCRVSQFAHVHVGVKFDLAPNDAGTWRLPKQKKIEDKCELFDEPNYAALPEPEP
ncbi:hypothetical protein AB4239_21505, partial [Vibrio sp. 10N.286.45.C10]